jgi:4-amino-4-deoxy-L-arabinose transferase-like glycosyltransferase
VSEPTQSAAPTRRWSPRSLAILFLAWLILQVGGLFSPGLLDDVDSIYIEIAREMLRRHDYVTPYINGIRFFDKPPLMYWMASTSMAVFGTKDWAARLPLALCVLALLIAVYALGIRLFASISPSQNPDRGGFYAALALATSIGPYLYTRFYIPDILLALWMTLAVHLFLIALARVEGRVQDRLKQPANRAPHVRTFGPGFASSGSPASAPLLPCLAFAAVLALNVLTKGLIGLVFPLAFVLLYLALTRKLPLLLKLHPISSTLVFLAIAAPWHILAALRNPAIAMPAGLGLPAKAGWAWFYLYNEHVARFLSKRIPHDYGLTPVWLFWLYVAIWVMPWTTFLPPAIVHHLRTLRSTWIDKRITSRATGPGAPHLDSEMWVLFPGQEAALSLLLWAATVLLFFSISNRQEYYSLPALPALALMAAGLLARADAASGTARRSTLLWHLYFLLPLATLIAAICAWFAITAPHPPPGTDLSTLLAANPEFYNLSLGHLFDLTGAAMGLFRGPLAAVALSMFGIGLGSYLLRRANRTYAANLTLAAAMTVTLLAAHEGLARFYPILGSKKLAEAINHTQQAAPQPPNQPADLILLDGELTSGSSLIFYTQQQVHLLNGRVNGLWYGSFWPDAPAIFETESSLRQLWQSPRRIFLFTYNPTARTRDLAPYAPVHTLATAGGKTILTNH